MLPCNARIFPADRRFGPRFESIKVVNGAGVNDDAVVEFWNIKQKARDEENDYIHPSALSGKCERRQNVCCFRAKKWTSCFHRHGCACHKASITQSYDTLTLTNPCTYLAVNRRRLLSSMLMNRWYKINTFQPTTTNARTPKCQTANDPPLPMANKQSDSPFTRTSHPLLPCQTVVCVPKDTIIFKRSDLSSFGALWPDSLV